MLERFARAFTSGNGWSAAQCWDVPALIVADIGVRSIASLQEIQTFYSDAMQQYRDMGVADTRPEVQRTDWLTDRLVLVQVRWPYLDAAGEATGASETGSYIVRFNEQGEPRITVAVVMNPSP